MGSFSGNEILLLAIFAVIIGAFLIIDLGVFNKKAKVVSTRSALYQSIFWIAISLLFGYVIYLYDGGWDNALMYYSAYLTEKALSVDNIFVIILILKYFRIEEKYYHKILFWGILGALVFRGVFIFLGAYLVEQFHWILYIFGIFLVYSGFKLLFEDDDDTIEPEKSPVIKFARRYLNISKSHYDGKFIVKEKGKMLFTPLFVVLMLIETTDLIFAVDSIPAAFAITENVFLIYTSNIFAVLGLRALFFLLAGILSRFHLLQKGLSLVLIFIGAKMLLEIVNVHVPIDISFIVILGTLILSVLISLWVEKPPEKPIPTIDDEEKPAEIIDSGRGNS